MTSDRAAILAAYRQAQQATEELGRWHGRGTLTAQRVRELLPNGAMSQMLPVAAWREAMQGDDVELVRALLDGAEGANADFKRECFSLGARHASPQVMQLLIERGFGAASLRENDLRSSPLSEAIRRDDVPLVRLLIEAGAVPHFTLEHDKTPRQDTALLLVRSPKMLQYLMSQGCRPSTKAMFAACLDTSHEPPRPALLQAFLDCGLPTEEPKGGMAWHMLFRDQECARRYPAEVVQCACMLLQANASRSKVQTLDLDCLVLALEAGLPPQEGQRSMDEFWTSRGFGRSQMTRRPEADGENVDQRRMRRIAADLVLRANEMGVDIDLLDRLGPPPGPDATTTFALAGVDPGQPVVLSDDEVAHATATSLARRTSNSPVTNTRPRRI